MKRVFFIETNPFGSRLHVLGPLIDAALESGNLVTLLHHPRESDAHWREWKASLKPVVTVRTVPHLAPKKPNTPIGRRPLAHMLTAVRQCARPSDIVVLTALDDAMFASTVNVANLRQLSRSVAKLLIVKYRVEGVLDRPSSAKGQLARAATHLIRAATKARLVIFDERYLDSASVEVIPDPWEGDFRAGGRSEARLRLGLAADMPIIGLIGRQDQRKGFATAFNALTRLRRDGHRVHCLLLGQVARAFQEQLGELRTILGDDFTHIIRFVPDEDLPDIFSACDVIWLPYEPSFTATSGVLARAAASGVPVVASHHGLVGHRVNEFKLGATFPARDDGALALQTLSLLQGQQRYDPASARAWSLTCTSQALVADGGRLFQA